MKLDPYIASAIATVSIAAGVTFGDWLAHALIAVR